MIAAKPNATGALRRASDRRSAAVSTSVPRGLPLRCSAVFRGKQPRSSSPSPSKAVSMDIAAEKVGRSTLWSGFQPHRHARFSLSVFPCCCPRRLCRPTGRLVYLAPRTTSTTASSPCQRLPALGLTNCSSRCSQASVADGKTVLMKNIKTPDPIPEEGRIRATEIMETGRLYRYNADCAETCEVSAVEKDLCEYTGHKYCVAVNSCGSAIFMAMKVAGLQYGDKVLSNAFTFQAVPSAIEHAGGVPVYVDCEDNFVIDVEDLRRKAIDSGAKFCVVSHMRGKVAEMDQIKEMCDEMGIVLIEDCAHSLGVTWKGQHTGHHGVVACISSQSYKMLNSGEGGFLLTNDDVMAAKAICYAGSYEKLYTKHLMRPADEVFEAVKKSTPNYSLRMHAVSAAMLRPQIATLDERIAVYNRRYEYVEMRLNSLEHCYVPTQLPEVGIVADSIQFHLTDFTPAQLDVFVKETSERKLPVEVFGAISNARYFRNWDFAPCTDNVDKTDKILQYAIDIRLPLMFTEEDFVDICDIVEQAHNAAAAS